MKPTKKIFISLVEKYFDLSQREHQSYLNSKFKEIFAYLIPEEYFEDLLMNMHKKDYIPYHEIDAEIVHIIKALNALPFLETYFCCAGYGTNKNADNHKDCSSAYVTIRYNDKNNSLKFHNDIINLDIFHHCNEKKVFPGQRIAYYMNYASDKCSQCLDKKHNFTSYDKSPWNHHNGLLLKTEPFFYKQEELKDKWSKILQFVQSWKR